MIPALPPLVTIDRYEYPADGGSHTFAGILALIAALPFTARHLVLTVNGQTEENSDNSTVSVRLNGDAGANYNFERLDGTGAVPGASRRDNQTSWWLKAPGDLTALRFGGGQLLIIDAFGGRSHNGGVALTGATEAAVQAGAFRRGSVAIVTSVYVAGQGGFKAGTILELAVVDERYLVAGGEQILTVDGTFTFTGLPQVPGDLCIIGNLRSIRAAAADDIYITINGDGVNANYFNQTMLGDNAGPPTAAVWNERRIGTCSAANATASAFGAFCASISQAALPDNDPHYLSIYGYHDAIGPGARAGAISGRRNNVAVVETLAFRPVAGANFVANSGMWVYFTPKCLLERIVLASPAASITFDNDGAGLSQNYRDLGVGGYVRSSRAAATDDLMLEHNGDAVAADYDVQRLTGDGAVVTAATNPASQRVAVIPGNTAAANVFGGANVILPAYTKADRHQHRLAISGAAEDLVEVRSSRWESLNPVTSATVYAANGDLMIGTVLELWGIGRVDDDIYIEVGGTEIANRQDGSLSIRNAIEERATCDFTIVDQPGTATYSKGQPVEVLQHCHPLFGGIIDSVDRRKLHESTTVFHAIRCTGWAALTDKRLAAESYTGQTAEYIIRDLATKYLNPEGIFLGNIETGPTISEMVLNYASLSVVLDKLAEIAGVVWSIDELKRLTFEPRTTTPAPWTVDPDMITKFTPAVTEKAPEYRNRQYVRAGRSTTAPQTEVFTGDGTTLSFTVGYPIWSVPTVTVGGAPQVIGIKGLEVGRDCYWSKSDAVIVFDIGSVPAPAAAIQIDYIGMYDLLILADDPTKIANRAAIEGGTGIWERIDDEPGITDIAAGIASAVAKLDKYSIIGRVYTFDTVQPDFAPGQHATVTWLGLGTALIESVEVSEIRADKPTYHITAITGPSLGDWTRLFRRLSAQKDEVLDRLTIGSSSLLIIVVREGIGWDWTETITPNVYACPVPSPTLYPSGVLYPC